MLLVSPAAFATAAFVPRGTARAWPMTPRRARRPSAAALLSCAPTLAPVAPSWAAATTELMSVGPHGRPANGESHDVALSADRRFVAFSDTSDLPPGDPTVSPASPSGPAEVPGADVGATIQRLRERG